MRHVTRRAMVGERERLADLGTANREYPTRLQHCHGLPTRSSQRVVIASLLCLILSSSLPAAEPDGVPYSIPGQPSILEDGRCTVEELRKIEEAVPTKAHVAPAKPRKLLMFELNVGYPGSSTRFPGHVYPPHANSLGHRSIVHANAAFV